MTENLCADLAPPKPYRGFLFERKNNMRFKTNGMYAYCVTETKDGCVINDGRGFAMEADQMIEIANKMIKYAKVHKEDLKQHNIRLQKEYEQSINELRMTPKKKKSKKKSYVYVFECGGYYKVGYSNNIERRIKELDKRPHKINVVCVSHFIYDAFEIEQYLHEKIKQYRINGEWYDLPENVLLEVCEYIDRQR